MVNMEVAHDHRVESVGTRYGAERGGHARAAIEQDRRGVAGDQVAGTGLPVRGHAGAASQDRQVHGSNLRLGSMYRQWRTAYGGIVCAYRAYSARASSNVSRNMGRAGLRSSSRHTA